MIGAVRSMLKKVAITSYSYLFFIDCLQCLVRANLSNELECPRRLEIEIAINDIVLIDRLFDHFLPREEIAAIVSLNVVYAIRNDNLESIDAVNG